ANHFSGDRLTEISAAIGQCRNRLKLIVNVYRFSKLFIVEEKKALVAAYRTAHHKTPIVSSLRRPGGAFWIGRHEGVARIQKFIHEILVGGAVEPIRPGLHRYIEESAADLSVFSSEIAGLDRDLLDRVDTGLSLRRHAGSTRICGFLALDS